jgi:hypothetical protein
MHQPLKKSATEARAILADVHGSKTHPSTSEKPAPGTPGKIRLMHAMHSALMKAGKLSTRGYERKTPQWPLNTAAVDVLGYGAEKVVYRVTAADDKRQHVVSVYHLESMKQDPVEVLQRKRDKYNKYREYFGDLVLPTAFIIVDNPWGDGAKPAAIQSFVDGAEKFASLGREEIVARGQADPAFAANLDSLTSGYAHMMADGLRPDFARSNLLIAGSDIVIFDTGHIYPSEKQDATIAKSPNYELIESLGAAA